MWLSVLTENTCKGIGKIGDLILAPYVREKNYKDTVRAAQAKQDSKAIESGRIIFDGQKIIPALSLPDIPQSILPFISGQEEEIHNLNANLNVAIEQLRNVPNEYISDKPVDPDWFARWRRDAKVIGNPELQALWGRILAEEVKTPQAVSFRTLDVIKNLTHHEANLFCEFALLIINESIPSEHFEDIISLDDIRLLQDAGLINSIEVYPVPLYDAHAKCNYLLGYQFILAFPQTNQRIIPIPTYSLTNAGIELYKIADNLPKQEIANIIRIGNYVWDKVGGLNNLAAYPLPTDMSPDFDNPLHIWER